MRRPGGPRGRSGEALGTPPGAPWSIPGVSRTLWRPLGTSPDTPGASPASLGTPWELPEGAPGAPGRSRRVPGDLLGGPWQVPGDPREASWSSLGRLKGFWEACRKLRGAPEERRRSVPAYIQNHQKTIDIYLKSEHASLSGQKTGSAAGA